MQRNRNADCSDDSDIEEIVVVTSRSQAGYEPTPLAKRRKSSPQMDPIPSYTPTPIHILEQRARAGRQAHGYLNSPTYNPTPILRDDEDDETYSTVFADSTPKSTDYVPLPKPSPSVVGRTTVLEPEPQQRVTRQSANRAIPRCSSTALRPVSASLAQAVARRRDSLQEKEKSKSSSPIKSASTSVTPSTTQSFYAEQPVMWSPQLPSEIEPIKADEEDCSNYTLPRRVKQRIAHKPSLTKCKSRQPRVPLGTAKKVPAAMRIKYLEIIINEFLNCGYSEEESNQEGLKEEEQIATRSANKNIYINLVASFKKKLREKAGISTLPPDNDKRYVNGNKVVSHDQIVTGKVIGTISIEKKRKSSDPSTLSEHELYDRLLRYVLPTDQLESYGYPSRDPDDHSLRKVPLGKDGQKQQLRPQLASSYTCERCSKVYRVDDEGMPLPTTGKCIYHPGHLWNERINRALEKRYSCCKGDQSAGGCSSNPYHVHKGELELANYKGYVETQPKPNKDPNKHGIYALDCEMCYTTYGLELTRVTVINYKSDVVYEKLVKPENPILDYNTKFSGIKQGDLDSVTTDLADVQQDLLNMFSSKTMLVGHSLDSDMKALKLFHKRFIDTAQLFPHKRGLPYKRALRTLMVEYLSVIIQEDVGHDSKEDASAAFRLVLWKARTDVPEKSRC